MLPPRRFVFVRHGQTDWNAESRIQGLTDIPLNAAGLAQAQATVARLAGFGIDRIISSPLSRALKTAAVLAEHLALPMHVDSALMERRFGLFEGCTLFELERDHGIPLGQAITAMPPDAEPWATTCERAGTVVGAWLQRHPDETLAFVSHGGVFRGLLERLSAAGLTAANATPYEFMPGENGSWQVSEIGATPARVDAALAAG